MTESGLTGIFYHLHYAQVEHNEGDKISKKHTDRNKTDHIRKM